MVLDCTLVDIQTGHMRTFNLTSVKKKIPTVNLQVSCFYIKRYEGPFIEKQNMFGKIAELTCPGDTQVSVSLATAAMMQHLIIAANMHLLRPL